MVSPSCQSVCKVAVYYAATAVAAIVYFAPRSMRDLKTLVLAGVLPGTRGVDDGHRVRCQRHRHGPPEYADVSWLGIGAVFWIGIGALVLGLIVTLAVRPVFPDFFSRRVIPVGTVRDHDFVIADPADAATPALATAPARPADPTREER